MYFEPMILPSTFFAGTCSRRSQCVSYLACCVSMVLVNFRWRSGRLFGKELSKVGRMERIRSMFASFMFVFEDRAWILIV